MRANGKFVLHTGNHKSITRITKSSSSRKESNITNQSVWFSKDDDEGCWMGFVDAHKMAGDGEPDQRKWIIRTAREILYMAPITGEKIIPRQGRWELGDGGADPAPTVNLNPLPTSFRLSGWNGHHDILNGEYLPLDDGSKLLNARPIFKHIPVVGVLTRRDKWRMYWSHGAWRIRNENQEQSEKIGKGRCIAFVESDATHPTAMPVEVVWKGTASEDDCGKDESHFEVVEGVCLATGMVRAQ